MARTVALGDPSKFQLVFSALPPLPGDHEGDEPTLQSTERDQPAAPLGNKHRHAGVLSEFGGVRAWMRLQERARKRPRFPETDFDGVS